jgi:hypothetical protein
MVGLGIEIAVRCEIPILTIVLNNGVMGGYQEHLPIATRKQGSKSLMTTLSKSKEIVKIIDGHPMTRAALAAAAPVRG